MSKHILYLHNNVVPYQDAHTDGGMLLCLQVVLAHVSGGPCCTVCFMSEFAMQLSAPYITLCDFYSLINANHYLKTKWGGDKIKIRQKSVATLLAWQPAAMHQGSTHTSTGTNHSVVNDTP